MKIKKENFYKYNNILTSTFLNKNFYFLIGSNKNFSKNNLPFVKGFRNHKTILKSNNFFFQLKKLKNIFNVLIKSRLRKILVIVNEEDYSIIKHILKDKKCFLVISGNNLNYYNSKTIMKAKNISVILFVFPRKNEIELISDGLRQKKLVIGLLNNKLNINFFDYPILINRISDKAKIFFVLFIKQIFKW